MSIVHTLNFILVPWDCVELMGLLNFTVPRQSVGHYSTFYLPRINTGDLLITPKFKRRIYITIFVDIVMFTRSYLFIEELI